MPRLEKALKESGCGDARESTELARSFRRTRLFIPTRAHPWMPNRPPFGSVIGFLSAPVDALGDIFRKFPDTADLHRTENDYMLWEGEHGKLRIEN